ncbi:MAG: hypothetical protein HQ455_09385 [Burkholderiales bacterium]|nr:hypothetical protein [Burkholderiales bacterium]
MRCFLLAACSLLFLTACDKPVNDNPLFPLGAGKRWTYEVETVYDDPEGKTVKQTMAFHNLGSALLADGSTAWLRRSSNGHEYWFQFAAKGVQRVAMKSPLQEQAVMDEEPRQVLPSEIAIGAKWKHNTFPYFLRRRNESPSDFRYVDKYKSIPMTYVIAANDVSLDTPAGHFEQCVRVDGKMELMLWHDDIFAYKPTPLLTREWFCPGVGLAQLERDEPTTARLFQGGRMRMRLTDFSP